MKRSHLGLAALWATTSTALYAVTTLIAHHLVTSILTSGQGETAVDQWVTDVVGVAGIGLLSYLAALIVVVVSGQPTIRRAIIAVVIAVVASQVLIDLAGAAADGQPNDVIGGITARLIYGSFVWGTVPLGLALPLAAALVPVWRAAVFNQPAHWSFSRFSPADADTAAEDWNIH